MELPAGVGHNRTSTREGAAMDQAQTEARGQREGGRRKRGLRLNTIWIGVTLIVILGIAYPIGYTVHNANAARAIALFAIGVVSFLGMLSLGHQGGAYRPFDSHEIRSAVTVAFVIVYFGVLSIFLFSINRPTSFANTVFGTFTPLMGVILGFYFASGAVEEFMRRRTSRTDPDGMGEAPERSVPPPAAPRSDPPSALETEVQELRALVASLMERAESEQAGNGKAARPRAKRSQPRA